MALYDIRINGVTMNTATRGVDEFNGRRIIPERKVSSAVIPGMPGEAVYLGEYDSSMFSIGMWVKGVDAKGTPSPAALEKELDSLLGIFAVRRMHRFEWQDHNQNWRWADVTIEATIEPEIDHITGLARLKIVFKNPNCFWRTIEMSQTSALFSTAMPVTGASSMSGVDSNAKLTIYGPAVNPRVTIGTHTFSWAGTIPTGGYITFDNALLRAEDNLKRSLGPLVTQSHPRYFEITPGSWINVEATGTSTDSKWTLAYTQSYA